MPRRAHQPLPAGRLLVERVDVVGNVAAKARGDRLRCAEALKAGFNLPLAQERQVPWAQALVLPWLCQQCDRCEAAVSCSTAQPRRRRWMLLQDRRLVAALRDLMAAKRQRATA